MDRGANERSDIGLSSSRPSPGFRTLVDMPTLSSVHTRALHTTTAPNQNGRELFAVSESLWVIGVGQSDRIDFFELHTTSLEVELGSSARLISSAPIGSGCVSSMAFSPHDPGLLTVGSSSGCVTLLRLRRGPSKADGTFGALMVHQMQHRALGIEQPVDVLRFHPMQLDFCAVACGGEVRLLRHGAAITCSPPCCAGAAATVTVEWCDSLLACGRADGTVSLYEVSIDHQADRGSLSLDLNVIASEAGQVAQADSAGSVTALRWVPADDELEHARGSGSTPLGILCCGYESAHFRAYVVHTAAEVELLAKLPSLPLRGAAPFGIISAPLALEISGQGEAAATGDSVVPATVRARRFHAAHCHWLLCAATG